VEKLLTTVCSHFEVVRVLSLNIQLIIIPAQPDMRQAEQSINNILMLKNFVQSVVPLYEALAGANSELIATIRGNCRPENIRRTIDFIQKVINDDVTYQKKPLDLRNQRTYAVKVKCCMSAIDYYVADLHTVWRQRPS
jgi:DNA mismatch repair protein MSH4